MVGHWVCEASNPKSQHLARARFKQWRLWLTILERFNISCHAVNCLDDGGLITMLDYRRAPRWLLLQVRGSCTSGLKHRIRSGDPALRTMHQLDEVDRLHGISASNSNVKIALREHASIKRLPRARGIHQSEFKMPKKLQLVSTGLQHVLVHCATCLDEDHV